MADLYEPLESAEYKATGRTYALLKQMPDGNYVRVVVSPDLKTKADSTTTAGYTYFGEAAPGTATSAAAWKIGKMNNTTSDTDWADGDSLFDNIWDNRASLSYS